MIPGRSKNKAESLADIDDNEIESYLHTDAQVRFKKRIWELINRDYLDEQAAKRSLPPEQKLPSDQKRRRAGDSSDPGSKVAAETSHRSSKVNYEALNSFFRDLDRSAEDKGRRIEQDARVASDDDSDPCKVQEEVQAEEEEQQQQLEEEDPGGDEYYEEERDFDYDEYEESYDLYRD